MIHTLTSELASRFATVALGHVGREYPNKLDQVLESARDLQTPRALHPIFYGSFDWHSCVHSHWLLARLHRLFPELPETEAIVSLLDAQFVAEKVAGELAFLQRAYARGFERPYGWAWLLKLQAELLCHTGPEGKRWAQAMQPLADAFVKRFEGFLPLCIYPIRSGVHSSTSFALTLAMDYARRAENHGLRQLICDTALRWHGRDEGANPFEPSQSDFLSPTLMEAALMRSVLAPSDYREWIAKFLPKLPQSLLMPATVTDRSDGQIAHLDGLNLSRAWCWQLIASALPPLHPWRENIAHGAERLLASALDHIAGDYMGEHWLASFALLALDPFD